MKNSKTETPIDAGYIRDAESSRLGLPKTAWRSFDFAARIFTGVFVFIYGALKPWQFSHVSEDEIPVELLGEEYGYLMWYFFSRTQVVPCVIGVFECAGAVMLFFNRTKLVGAITLLPVLSVIVLFDFVFGISELATANAVVYAAVCIYVIITERRNAKAALACLVVDEGQCQWHLLTMKRVVWLMFLTAFFLLALTAIHWVA